MRKKRFISLALALAMLLSLCPITAMATDEEDFEFEDGVITYYEGSGGRVEIPATIGGQAVTAIGDGAFADNEDITEVVIPKGVTAIGDDAFYYCVKLASVVIPEGVTTIGENAFADTALESVVIPEGVTTIGDGAFHFCEKLASVTIPKSVTTIGPSAFAHCLFGSVTFMGQPATIGDAKKDVFQLVGEWNPCTLNLPADWVGEPSVGEEVEWQKGTFTVVKAEPPHTHAYTGDYVIGEGDNAGKHGQKCSCGEVGNWTDHVFTNSVCVCGAADGYVWVKPEDCYIDLYSTVSNLENYMDYSNFYLLTEGDFNEWKQNDNTLNGLKEKCFISAIGEDWGYGCMDAEYFWGSLDYGDFTKLPPKTKDEKFILPATMGSGEDSMVVLVLSSDTDYYCGEDSIPWNELNDGYLSVEPEIDAAVVSPMHFGPHTYAASYNVDEAHPGQHQGVCECGEKGDWTDHVYTDGVCVCGAWETHVHEGITFAPIGSYTELVALFTEGGAGYLTGNVSCTGALTVSQDVQLCLNGKVLNLNKNHIEVNGTLDLYDCGTTKRYYDKADNGQWTLNTAKTSGDCSTTGGVITGGNATSGGGVYVDGGSFTMKNGTICGNTAKNYGGGVYVNTGSFTMTGGSISGNTASISGGGVYVAADGSFTMTGGTISDNTAQSFGGGGVYVHDNSFTMTGGTISGNTAPKGGGGVYVNGSRFTMTGGTISDNTATSSNGGGVHVNEGSRFTMTGGTISGNTAKNYGGGVFANEKSSVILGGTATVRGNKAQKNNLNDSNIHLQNNGKTIVKVSTETPLVSGADIGITFYMETDWAPGTEVGSYLGDTMTDGNYMYFVMNNSVDPNVGTLYGIAKDTETSQYVLVCRDHAYTGDYVIGEGENEGKHGRKCVNDGCTEVGNWEDHVYSDGVCVCGAKLAASISDTYYATLQAAVAAAQPEDIITLLADCEGKGILIDKPLTIDFDNHTYTISGEAIGGTETSMNQGFHIEYADHSTKPGVTLKNGTLAVPAGNLTKTVEQKPVTRVLQNYVDLTMENMTITDENVQLRKNGVHNPVEDEEGYVSLARETLVECDSGNSTFTNCTITATRDNRFALALDDRQGMCPTGTHIKVVGGTVGGNIRFYEEDNQPGQKLISTLTFDEYTPAMLTGTITDDTDAERAADDKVEIKVNPKTEGESYVTVETTDEQGQTIVEIIEDVTSCFASLTLSESLNLNFYVYFPKTMPESQRKKFTVRSTFLDQKEPMELLYWGTDKDGSLQYRAVVAKAYSYQMTEPVKIELFYGGSVIKSTNYSVQQYLETFAGKDDKMSNLATACLSYGGAAQRYFGGRSYVAGTYPTYTADQMADKNFQYSLESVEKPDAKAKLIKEIEGLSYSASMILGNELTMKIYLGTKAEGATITAVRHDNDADVTLDDPVLFKEQDGSYSFKVTGIRLIDLNKSYTMTITKGDKTDTLTYSPYTYLAQNWDGSMGELSKAMKAVGDESIAYFGY